MAVGIANTIRASLLFKPVAGTLAAGILTTDAYNAASQSFTNPAAVLWNSGQFNTQGQKWEAVNGGDPTAGCRNVATPRTVGDVRFNHVTEFEFLYTGAALDIQFIAGSYYDCQVYVEWGGRMHKAQAAPITGTTSGLMNRRLVFANPFHGRIRVHLAGGLFVGINCEQSAIVKPSPDRLFGICDGSDSADGKGLVQSSGVSYLTAGLCDYLFERTGIVWARRAQSLTGFFFNGAATVTDDAAASDNSTRWFSQSRKDWMAPDLAAKPLFFLLVGTLGDGGRSGATGASTGPMATRELACLQWIRSLDQFCTIAHVSPSPYTGSGAAGTLTGPPTAGSGHDLNRLEQAAAIAKVPRAAYINAFGPTLPWYTGTGGNGTPSTSQQAALIGADGANFAALGADFYAGKIAAELGQLLVNAARARRQQ